MTKHICMKCKRIFKQKSHLRDHMNKKVDCSLLTSQNINENIIISNNIRTSKSKANDRELVQADFDAAIKANAREFDKNDPKATEKYIFPNQETDAQFIVNKLVVENKRVISVQKKTKVGADGLMIRIVTLLTTHIDDYILDPDSIRIITGMNNVTWERDMKCKSPYFLKDKIFHHGQLLKADLMNIKNGIIIIDEIDTGDKEYQVLHNTLTEAGILDVKHMKENNNRFVFISATMFKELYHLYQWGEDLHEIYKMTIPDSYIGHKYLLNKEIIKEFYPLTTSEKVEQWIKEDIIENYASDYRVHIVRVNTKTVKLIQNECIRKGITFKNHTSDDRLTEAEEEEFFINTLTKHVVLAVKGFFRRATLLPDVWKLRIGATHEFFTKKIDDSVQIQGLPGRMTGYWKKHIEGGHKTGPHRTSIIAINRYEESYENPYGENTSYQTDGFNKKNGRVLSGPTMFSPNNILNLNPVDLPNNNKEPRTVPVIIDIDKEVYSTFTKISGDWDKKTILEIIKEKGNNDIYDRLQKMISEYDGIGDSCYVTQPIDTYHIIEAAIDAKNNKRVWWHNGNDSRKDVNKFVIFLDNKNYKIIVGIYNGKKENKE